MTRKLLLDDLGIWLALMSMPCNNAIGAYRDMAGTLTKHGGVAATQSSGLLFRESISHTLTSMGGFVGVCLFAALLAIVFRIGSKTFEKPMFREPYFWLKISFLILWLLLLPLAEIAGNYFALWHPVSDDAIARFQFGQRGLILVGLVLVSAGILQSWATKPRPPGHVSAQPE